MSRTSCFFAALAALTAVAGHAAEPPTAVPAARYSVEGAFDAVTDDVRIAIESHGLIIDHASRVNDMLERTGKDLGSTQKVFLDAEVFSFCSAVMSRKMMEADPHNIAFCPFVISVYVLPQEPKRVYVAFRRPEPAGTAKSRAALRDVEHLLDDIVREALSLKK